MPIVKDISTRLKKIYHEKGRELFVLVGGSHATITKERVLIEHSVFDIACIGEGEITFVEILNALQNGKNLKEVKGVVFRDKDKQVVATEKRPFITSLDTIPFPDWSLLPELKKFYRPAGDSLKRAPSKSTIPI